MLPRLEAFAKNLSYWLEENHDITMKITKQSEDRFEADLLDDEGEEFYIGSYADPGIAVKWLGPGPNDSELVEVNGVIFQALGKHVAGWVVGYE